MSTGLVNGGGWGGGKGETTKWKKAFSFFFVNDAFLPSLRLQFSTITRQLSKVSKTHIKE